MNFFLMLFFVFFCVFLVKKLIGIVLQFIQFLELVEVFEGIVVKFVCIVKGILQLIIEWFKDGEFLKISKCVKDDFDGEVVFLFFIEIDLDDEGDYKCVVQNELGLLFCIVEFFVNEFVVKLEFIEVMKGIEVGEDEEGRFEVCVLGSFSLIVQWFKGNKKIEDVGKFFLIDDEEDDFFFFVIDKVILDDVGIYICKVNNEIGEVLCEVEFKL